MLKRQRYRKYGRGVGLGSRVLVGMIHVHPPWLARRQRYKVSLMGILVRMRGPFVRYTAELVIVRGRLGIRTGA